MPGCSGGAQLASMTGSTDLGPIQSQQDSAPLLDDSLFTNDRRGYSSTRSSSARRKMTPPTGGGLPVQLTPLWEYVVRTKKFPRDVDVATIFEEISQRLRDPEWEVRQHALRVLVDVLPTFGPKEIDEVAALVLSDLVDNLGNSAPAVRKGSLDALRIYLLHTSRRDEMTTKILHDGMNRPDVLDDYQTSIATGVILSTPLLLFPSRSSTRPGSEVVRAATQALAMRLVQVTHQESALRSLAKIREAIGEDEFAGYLKEVDDSMKRNFDLLCDVYGIKRSSPTAKRKRPKSRTKQHSADKSHRKDSVEESIKDVVAMDKSWESEEDSDTSGIAEGDEEGSAVSRSGSSGGITSARVVLETEIKFNEETAITMTILEEREKEKEGDSEEEEEDEEDEDYEEDEGQEADGEIEAADEDDPLERRKTPRRVHFGGEIVKLRTPDSEDAESVFSDVHLQPQQLPRTRIPLPVSPATRLPPQQPRRVRSSSQPSISRRQPRHRQKRSASSSPRREIYVHDGNLSPKKSILTRSHRSRRDSITPLTSPRIVIQEVDSPEEPSFRVCEEPQLPPSPKIEENVLLGQARPASPSPSVILGDICGDPDKMRDNIDSIFGDKSGLEFQEKIQKDHENMMRSVYRSRSALEKTTKFDWMDEDGSSSPERRRSSSAKSAGFEVFPRQERNYILMELSSPTKDLSRRASLEDNPIGEIPVNDISKPSEQTDPNGEKDKIEDPSKSESEQVIPETKSEEPQVDSNKTAESDKVKEGEINEEETEAQLGIIDDDLEKSALDAKERSSDSSSDGEWKQKEPSWEELGLVDEEILNDFHNKDDWRARVRGLERIASALRAPPALEAIEPRLGSLLHAVLGGERSCRVAAAGLAVARVVLTGVSEDALKDRLSLIAWGLARQGGPNAAHLARLVMLRTSPGLFVEKLLQPQCIGARNAKMRENTLQLFIFSLVTFPSTEFKVKSAIDKVVAMVGDRRKRVRYSALDTLAVMSQIYDSEDILEASKRFTKGKQDGQTIHTAIKTRLSRKLLPTVSVDGLVVYGLQISSNSPHTGADVEWIEAGSGSVSPGTGRTRGQLIAMSRMENEQSHIKKPRSRPVSEHSILGGSGLLEKSERTASWKLLPQSDSNDKQNQDIKSKKIGRASKSADISKVTTSEFDYHKEQTDERVNKNYKPYATPKRSDRNLERQINSESKTESEVYSTQVRPNNSPSVPRQESRIPIYTGDRTPATKTVAAEMNSGSRERSPADAAIRRDKRNVDYGDDNGYLSIHQRRKLHAVRSAVPRTNHAYDNGYRYDKSLEDMDELQAKFREDRRHSPLRDFKENDQRTSTSYEKLNKNFDTVIKNSRAGLRSVPHYQYSSKVTETYESIYQRQRRSKEERSSRSYVTSPNSLSYGYDYEGYGNRRAQFENDKNAKESKADQRSPHRRRMFVSPFDDRTNEKTMRTLCRRAVGVDDGCGDVLENGNVTPIRENREPTPVTEFRHNGSANTIDKDADQETDTSSTVERNFRVDSGRTLSKSAGSLLGSPRHDGGEARSNSGSSSSSNRSSGVRRVRVSSSKNSSRHQTATSLPVQSESDESNVVTRSEDKAFDVISAKSHSTRRNTPDATSIRTEIEEDLRTTSGSDDHPLTSRNHFETSSSASADSVNGSNSKRRSAESLRQRRLSVAEPEDESPKGNDLQSAKCNGYAAAGDRSSASSNGGAASRPGSARVNGSPARSMVGMNGVNDNEREPSESPEEDAAFETLDFRNAARETTSVTSIVVTSPVRSRGSYEYDNDLRNTDSNVTLYSCTSVIMSPKSSSPKRFISEDPPSKDTDDSDETPPLPIGFDNVSRAATESSDAGTDETDDVSVKPQPSRLPTPIDLPRRLCKVSPCKMRPQANCYRAASVPATRHPEKMSKPVQLCFTQLESKDWEVTLKGLRTLSKVARDEPEQLDVCAPGLLARVLGKHVKNLRSQVARVACFAAGEVFAAHVRGIDQDLDEIAGPLLHRTADTNRFLREDCNVALDSMIEHFPPNRTIMTIANRGASHQNTIVHATTARLLYVIVSEIGPENAMNLPREVKDKLFATTAKLLTDGNLQARKHAKETFRLLSRCDGFRKALTDAVPESTLRLIEKTLRSL